MIENECGNARHPSGPWHPAAALPASWEWRERLRQWWRKMRWGCGCPTDSQPNTDTESEGT